MAVDPTRSTTDDAEGERRLLLRTFCWAVGTVSPRSRLLIAPRSDESVPYSTVAYRTAVPVSVNLPLGLPRIPLQFLPAGLLQYIPNLGARGVAVRAYRYWYSTVQYSTVLCCID